MRIERRNDLDLRLIEAFAAVIEHGTTPAAAEVLGMSQSAVWNAVRNFEAQLDLVLFRREGRRLVVTDAGLAVYRDIRPLIGALDVLAGRLRRLRQHRRQRLDIAATSSLGRAVVPPALRRFLAGVPGIEIGLELGSADQVAQAVSLGLADLGLLLGPVPDAALAATLLGRAELVAILPQDNLLTSRAVVGPADLDRFDLIGGGPLLAPLITGAFALQGLGYAPRLICNREDGACAMVHAGLGVAVIDPYSAEMSRGLAVVTRRFAPATSVPVMALQRKTDGPGGDPVLAALLAALTETIEALAPAGWG